MLRFEDALSRIYADPSQAAQRIFAHTDKPGADSAFAELHDRPSTFGPLRADSSVAKWASGRSRHEEAARSSIADATSRGLEAYDAVRNVHGIAKAHGIDHLSLYEVSAMVHARAQAAAERAGAAQAVRDGAPAVADTRNRLAQTIRDLANKGDATLGAALSAGDLAIARPVLNQVRSAFLGHEEHNR
jgi:hypothetical protein